MDGRRNLSRDRVYEVKEIWNQHQEIIRLVVLGYGNVEIAELTGYTPQTISNIRNSPIVRERIEELQGQLDRRTIDITARVREFEPVALEHLERIIRGEVEGVSPALRAKTCENYLSRGGHGTVQKIASMSGTLSREDIEDLKKRAKEAALAAGSIAMESVGGVYE
jgi:DNA-binding MarR family transcriptional regulator